MKRNEKKLLRRLKAGDRTACVDLIDAHYQQVYWYLLNLGKDGETAADLTQNTFTKAWNAIDRFKGASTFRTWLFSIARNEFLQEMRIRGKYPELVEYTDLELVSDPGTPLEEELDARDLQDLLQKQVQTLPGKYREVISLHYFSGLSLREVAATLSVPHGTVKSRLNTALTQLKEKLDKLETGYEPHGSEKTAAICAPNKGAR